MWLVYICGIAAFLLPVLFLCTFTYGVETHLREGLAFILSGAILWGLNKFAGFHESALLGEEEKALVSRYHSGLKIYIADLVTAQKELALEKPDINPISCFVGMPEYKERKLRFRFDCQDLDLIGVEAELKKYRRAYLAWIYTRCRIPCRLFGYLWAIFGLILILDYIKTEFFKL